MIKITQWSPDTCSCIIQYACETDNPSAEPTVHAIVRQCSVHSAGDNAKKFSDVLTENRGKNKAVDTLCKTLPELTKKDENGNDIPDLNKISFEYDQNRKLVLKCKGINANKLARRDAAKAEIEKNIGAGNVDIIVL